MPRAPEWTSEEFDILLQNNNLEPSGFREILPQRGADAIEILRNGIHAYHEGMIDSMLSIMMRERLSNGGFQCPKCEQEIPPA
jgi:hypothetical protein